MNRALTFVFAATLVAATGSAQEQKQGAKKGPASPPAQTSAVVGGKKISIRYSAPSMRGRTIFGPNGVVSKDSTYPVWRAGANAATALTTDADLDINGLSVPKGTYSLYVFLDEGKWQLIVNKQTGQSGMDYDQKQDLGRVPMNMSKPPAAIETYKMTLSSQGGSRGSLQLEWENAVASVPFTAK